MEPRNGYSRGKPTVCKRWKAAVLSAGGRVRRTPPGSESGACLHRGNSGTWESHLSPCPIPGMGDRVTKGPGVPWGLPPGHEPVRDTTNAGSRQGIGKASDKRSLREGQRAVVASYSTDEGGEVRPKRPTGGKATSGRACNGQDTRERHCAHQSCHQPPIGLHPGAAEALLEEPYACIAPVRVCGGGAPFNGIRDHSRRALRVDSGVRGTQHASRCGTPWGVKPVDNGPTSASHTADERATPAT